MIKKALESIKDIFIPVRSIAADITLGTEIECAIDGEVVPCEELQDPEYTYIGVPCLLYTSPSPRDKRQSRMPSSA